MSSSDEELVAFWAARLDEEEAAAKAAQGRNPAPWTWKAVGARDYLQEVRDARGSFVAEFAGGADVRPESAIHAVRHDPARALREVEADRRILASYADFCREVEEQRAERGEVGPGVWAAYRKLCDVIRIRAVVHRGHPDYQERWSP